MFGIDRTAKNVEYAVTDVSVWRIRDALYWIQ
jgi:hypothetical protein